MAPRITVRVPEYDADAGAWRLRRRGLIGDSMGLDATLRRNAVGSWRLAVPLGGRSDDLLHEPQASIDVRDEWGHIFSGPVTGLAESEDANGPRLQVDGEDDNGWIAARIALPYPVPSDPVPVNLLYPELVAGSNATILPDFPIVGSPLRSVRAVGAGDMRWGSPGVLTGLHERVTPVQGGETYSVSVTIRSPTTIRTARLFTVWLSQPAGHTAVDSPTAVQQATASTVVGADVTLSADVVAPADAEAVYVMVEIVGAAGNEQHYSLLPVLTHVGVTGWPIVSDDRAGFASSVLLEFVDVNAGPGADADRRVAGLVEGSDPAVGAEGTWHGTGQNLADLVSLIALEGGVSWRVASGDDGTLVPEVRLSQRVPGAVFGFGRRNLLAYQLAASRGRNAVYTGGATFPSTAQGVAAALVARLELDSPSEAAWGRAEAYVAGSSSLPDHLARTALANLEAQGGQASVAISPINDGALRYGRDYFLGDEVGVQTRRGVVWAIAEQVKMTWDANGERVAPSLGVANRRALGQLVRRVDAAERALNELEKR